MCVQSVFPILAHRSDIRMLYTVLENDDEKDIGLHHAYRDVLENGA